MTRRTHSLAAAAAAIVVLAVPATASAMPETGVKAVRAHTDRADAALDRALARIEGGAGRRAEAELQRSRRELGRAAAAAAKLARTADTAAERRQAATAHALVGGQRDENIDELAGALDAAEGRVERAVAKAALADTRGREKAIAVIAALLEDGVPAVAAERLTTTLAQLSSDRAEEAETEAHALASDDVADTSKQTLARAVEESLTGQATAAATLASLLADEDMPQEAKAGLQTAYDAVTADHASATEIVSRVSEHVPAAVREFIVQVVAQARSDAQSMAEQRPVPPAGAPETAAGRPQDAPTGEGADRRP